MPYGDWCLMDFDLCSIQTLKVKTISTKFSSYYQCASPRNWRCDITNSCIHAPTCRLTLANTEPVSIISGLRDISVRMR